jgi:nitric oxide reductase subunit C|tara:strand:+ start:3561 stop:3977 length:417 start_codon:yes stop_codon:yes gene_type:complete
VKYIPILFTSYCLIAVLVYGSAGNGESHAIRQENQAAQAGLQLWRRHNCVSCHSIYGKGGHIGADLTNVVSRRGAVYIEHILETGKGSMPRFPFHDNDVENLIGYLQHINQLGTYPLKNDMSAEFFGHNSEQVSSVVR